MFCAPPAATLTNEMDQMRSVDAVVLSQLIVRVVEVPSEAVSEEMSDASPSMRLEGGDGG